jgi:Mg-chelatase subunit ChlD
VDVTLSYDADGVVQVVAVQRDTRKALPMRVEPVPDDLSWLGVHPAEMNRAEAGCIHVYLLMDASSSMAGEPMEEARDAARAFLARCDFTRTRVGLISFSDQVVLQAEATDNPRRLSSALLRIEADGTTNLAEAIELARSKLQELEGPRYIVILTDGYPDSPEAAVEEAEETRRTGLQIIAIGTGDADREYLRRLASTEEGSVFADRGELVGAFGHIARVIAEGGRGLRKL